MKLHVYLDDWLIRADAPELAQLQAQTTFRVLQFLARSSTSRSPISHQVKTSSSLGCSSTLDVSQWRSTEDASKGPVSSSALDDQSEHHGQRFAQTTQHAGVHGLRWSGEDGSVFVQSNSGPPQHCARGPGTGPTGFKFHSGSVRDGMVVIPSSPARSTTRHQGDGSNSLHRCVQFELGSQLGSRSTRGRWSASQRSCHISGDAGCHLRCERLPTSSEVLSGAIDVRQRSDGGVHQERGGGGTRSHTLMQMTKRLLKCCDSKAITLVPIYLPGVHNIQADSLSRVDQTLTTEWTMAMESLRPVFAKWGELRIYLFATFTNRRLVKFVSPYPDPRAEWTDAMSMPWDYGRDLPVRVPVIQDGPASTAEDRSVTRSEGDFDRSTATGSIMVPRVDGPFPRRSDPAVRRRSRPTDTRRLDGRRGDRESSLPTVKSTRVETLRAILRAKGHSREAANMMSRCLQESSQQVYESHWSRFVAFCGTKRWHVFRVRSHHFSTYMMHLFRDGLLPSTLISHRTSGASVLRHWVYDPAADPHIKLLVRAFRLERPVQRRIMPKWDLHLVLSLLQPPFIFQIEVHWNRNIRDIMRSHISRWIVETVKEAYTRADR